MYWMFAGCAASDSVVCAVTVDRGAVSVGADEGDCEDSVVV